MSKHGIVYLVGAGPGDPGLITVRGVECLRSADVIIYDYLANPVFLDIASNSCRKIYAGKKGATHSREQEEINDLMVAEARKGRVVVRLKGGDPFLFGRGGEEAEALASAGVDFEVVPGVTSAIAVPAYAGIPVTHRDFSSTVAFVTGHEKDEVGSAPPNWSSLAHMGTLVFLMSFANLPHIVEKLREAGLSGETPAAVIEWGTLSRQKVASATLDGIVPEMKRRGIKPPTIVVIGQAASLREKISWFEKRPLFGKTIVVTRSRDQAGELSRLLRQQGADVAEIPTIEIRSPSSWKPMDRALQRLSRYDWLIFTSANGVRSFFERLRKKGRDVRALTGIRLACVGPATARGVEAMGLKVDCVAKEFSADHLLVALKKKGMRGKPILFLRAKEGRDVLVEGLKALGGKVDLVEAYRSLPPRNPRSLPREVDLIVFASSATAENFSHVFSRRDIPVASIGPVTSKTAKRLGFRVEVQSKKATLEVLVKSIVDYFTG